MARYRETKQLFYVNGKVGSFRHQKYQENTLILPFRYTNMPHKYLFLIILGLFIGTSASAQQDSLEILLDTVSGERKVKALNELFRAHLQTDPVKALSYTQEALNLATEINDERGKAAAYNNLGVAYRNQGALDKALEYYLNSMKIYQTIGNKEGIATTKNNIANIYSMKKDYAQAMRYLEDSYKLFNELKDGPRIIGSMNNLGNLYSDLQLYEKAYKYYSEAYQLSEKSGDKFADPLNNLGNIYFKQSNFEKATEFYQRAFEIEKENNNKLGMLNTVSNLGIAYAKAKKPQQAQQFLDHALALSNDLQAFSLLPAIYKSVAENYYNQGKMKQAYEYQLKYDEQREKIFGDESSRNIAQMEMILNFQAKERELELLKKESEIQSLELKNSRLFIIVVIMAVIIVIALFNLFYLDRKKKFVTS
jgi:tetratricopeptide (TPR) repeat protein